MAAEVPDDSPAPGWRLYYEVVYQRHYGYCSDPGEYETITVFIKTDVASEEEKKKVKEKIRSKYWSHNGYCASMKPKITRLRKERIHPDDDDDFYMAEYPTRDFYEPDSD